MSEKEKVIGKIKDIKKRPKLLIAIILIIAGIGCYCYFNCPDCANKKADKGAVSVIGDTERKEPIAAPENKEKTTLEVVNQVNAATDMIEAKKEEIKKELDKEAKVMAEVNKTPLPTPILTAVPNNTCKDFQEADFRAKLKANFKDFGNYSISDGVLPGTKQLVTDRSEVFFATCDASLLFLGAIINTKGENITAQVAEKAQMKNNASILNGLDLNLGVKVGNGKHILIEFTDVRCPYCLNAEQVIQQNNYDITRYMFFLDIKNTMRESVHILCAKNKEEAYHQVIRNEVSEYKSCPEGLALFEKHRDLANKLGVQGTPTFFKDGRKYMGLVPALVDQIMSQEQREAGLQNKAN